MAARSNKVTHDTKTKRLIQASQLLNRLYSFANDEIELSAAQVNAAKIVIAKSIPDLKALEVQVEGDVNVRIGWGDPHSVQSETITSDPA